MGLAKHHEKIFDIVFERIDMLENSECESKIKLVCSAQSTPPTKVSEEINGNCKGYLPKKEQKYKDKHIVCLDCGKEFLFSARSQKYFANKKWEIPKRCKCCRDFRNVRYLMCVFF